MPSKKESLIEFNRTNILKSAEKLFLSKGVRGTTVDDIAHEAEYSKATLYAYFKSKEEIYDCILLKSMVLLEERLNNAINSVPDFEEKYYSLCNAILHYAWEYPLYFESLLNKIDCRNEHLYIAGEKINTIIGDLMKSGVEAGFLRPDIKFPQIILTMWACVSGLIRISAAKADYIGEITGGTAQEFARYGFETLLGCIKEENVK